VAWREHVARTKRASFADQQYWGRPVPGFGPADARILILGLAPAAHGANRTGRMFTGDRSGDWLYAALERAGLANQPTSIARDDGLQLRSTRVSAAVRCAPPANKPSTEERDACAHWLDEEVAHLGALRVLVALGGFAWTAALSLAGRAGWAVPAPRPRFGHGARAELVRPGAASAIALIGSYHPSQQNTFTGKLTEPMLDDVLRAARLRAELS
jgi:uracil-DNA glycosylase family 4